ncbi:MAG: hypothetical protein ACLFPS_09485, partial [Clostridia bacterium]
MSVLLEAKKSRHTVLTPEIREQNLKSWIELFRAHIDIFMEEYLGMHLYDYQRLMIRTMHTSRTSTIVAARATAKSFLAAAYANAMAILYPGLQIVLVAPSKHQAGLLISKKIEDELAKNYPNINKEIENIQTGTNKQQVDYYNGSCIFVRAANEAARGARGQIIIFEESAHLNKKIVDEVFKPMTSYRNIPFKGNKEFERYQADREFSRRIFITSAPWSDSNWVAKQAKKALEDMKNGKKSNIFLALDWVLAAKHIKPIADIADDKVTSGELSFMREFENIIPSIVENGAFTIPEIEACRLKRKMPYYPRETIAKVVNDPTYIKDGIVSQKTNIDPRILEIDEIKGERRLLAIDVAQKAGKNLSIISFLRFYPKNIVREGKPRGKYYKRELLYLHSMSGMASNEQALLIRRFFEDFKAEEIVIDVNIAGRAVAEALGKEMYDEERESLYAPIKPFKGTDDDLENKAASNAIEALTPIEPGVGDNQRYYFALKKALSERKIVLLNNKLDSADLLSNHIKEFPILNSEQRALLMAPFEQTDELKAELLQLSVEYTANNKNLRIFNSAGGRKDRYSAVSYGNWRIEQIEEKDFNTKSKGKLD